MSRFKRIGGLSRLSDTGVGGAGVKSIQYGTISVPSGTATSGSYTLPQAVDRQNSMLITSPSDVDGTGREYQMGLTLTSDFTVSAIRSIANKVSRASFFVVEFYPGIIKAVHRGNSLMTSTNTVVSVPEIDPGKTIVNLTGVMNNISGLAGLYFPTISIVSPTELRFQFQPLSVANTRLYYEVVEFA